MHACVFLYALRPLGPATSEKHFLWPLRNAAFLWCRLSVTLRWRGLERGRANSVSVCSQRSDQACHSGSCGDGSLGWTQLQLHHSLHEDYLNRLFRFFGIQIETKGKCASQQQGALLQTAMQTIQSRWTLDNLAQKEMTAQLFETRSNYWWVGREKWMWFSVRGNLKKTG